MKEEEILKKLDTIIALLAIQGKEDENKIKILKSLGHSYNEISTLTGIPAGTLKSRSSRKTKRK